MIEGKQYKKAIEIKDIKKIILPENLIFFTFVIKDPKIIPLNKIEDWWISKANIEIKKLM